ncbi:MAG: hypothetical protein IAF38_13300 [Bacteroidia bacterium]|nr:hypothetical protein [Bacteroidia bacterium]
MFKQFVNLKMNPDPLKPKKFFYILAAISCIGALWLIVRTFSTAQYLSFDYPYFPRTIYWAVTGWLSILFQLTALSGGIIAFRKPKVSWYFLITGAMGISFSLFNFIDSIKNAFLAYWLFPLPGQSLKFEIVYIDMLVSVLFFVMMFFIFFSRAGRTIKMYEKILHISLLLLLFIILFLAKPENSWGG